MRLPSMTATSRSVVSFLAAQGPLLDVRSPGEYAQAHIPGALSLPLFDDAERAEIGFDPEADARAVIDPVVTALRDAHPSLEIHLHVVEGHAADVLVEASRRAALLVVSSRGHRSFSGVVLGSVSQHCVTHAECPVVVVRTPSAPRHSRHSA